LNADRPETLNEPENAFRSLAGIHDLDVPAQNSQLRLVPLVTPPVPLQFGKPVRRVGLRSVPVGAIVAMPEATVDKHGGPIPRQDDIWRSREILPMKPVTEPGRVKGLTDG